MKQVHWSVRIYNEYNADRFDKEQAIKQRETSSEEGSFNQSKVIEFLDILQGQSEGE